MPAGSDILHFRFVKPVLICKKKKQEGDVLMSSTLCATECATPNPPPPFAPRHKQSTHTYTQGRGGGLSLVLPFHSFL